MSFPSKRFRSGLKVKKDLSDFRFKTLWGIDSRTTGSATASVIPLSNATTAYFSQLQLSGRTYTNRASWGGCESTDGWTTSDIDLSAVGTVQFEGTNCLKMAVAAGKSSGYIRRDILADLDITKYYLLSACVKNVDATNIQFSADCVGDAGVVAATAVTGTTYTRSGVVIQPSDFNTATQVYFTLTTTGAETKYTLADACMPVEISATEYALGAAACMALYPFVLGTKSTPPSEIAATGKNLVDNTKLINGSYINASDGTVAAESVATNYTGYIQISPSTQYIPSGITTGYSGGATGWAVYDINKVFVTGYNVKTVQTVPANAYYAMLTVSEVDKNTFQLEQAATATTYAPYQSVKSYTPILHSVPAIADTYDCVTGVHTKNVCSPYTLVADDIVSYDTFSNVDVISTKVFADSLYSALLTTTMRIYGYKQTCENSVDYDTQYIGYFYLHSTKAIKIIVAPDTYADLAACKAALAGTVIYYQLATPTVTQETATGMASLVSGTVTQDNIIKDGGTYSSGLTITDSTYPIVTLAEVYKTASGTITQITLASCTVAGDGLSFTSTELNNGDVVTYRYYRSPFYTIGKVDYVYRTTA